MPNVQISDLPDAIIPMDLTGTFFEVQTVEGGVQVSRRVSGDQLTFTSGFEVEGTSLDDPAIGGGVFNGVLNWQNANNQLTGVLGFEPAGDEFVIQNLAEGGEISLRVRDGTVHLVTADYGVSIPTTGAIRVPVGTTAEEPAALNGQIRYDSDNNVFRGVVSGVWADLGGGGAALPTGTIGQTIVNNDGAEGYAATSGVFVDVNGIVRLENNIAGGGTTQLDVISTGLILRDTVTASPNNLFIRFIEDSGFPVTLANFGYVTSDIFTLDGLSTQVQLNTNSVLGVLISHIGVTRFQTSTSGFNCFGTRFDVDNDGADTTTDSRVRNLTGGVTLRINVGGDASISQIVGTTGGFEDDWLNFARNAGVTVRHNNVAMARSVAIGSGGFEVNNTVTGAGFERVLTTADLGGAPSFPIDAADNDQIRWGTGQDMLQFFDGTDMQFNAVDGVDFRFLGGTAGAEVMLTLIANGAVEIPFDGSIRIATTAEGADVAAGSTTLFDVVSTGLNLDATLGTRGDSGGIAWYWDESVTTGVIRQTSAAGVLEDNFITMVINGAVALFHNGTNMAQTQLAASGGLQINNALTGAGFERALTANLVDNPFRTLLAAQKTMTSTEVLTDVTGFAATLLSSTRYKFRIVLFVNSGIAGDDPGLRLNLDFTGSDSSKEGRILEFRNSGLVQSVRALPNSSTITALNAGTTTDENMLVYEGFIETITSGTLQLEAAQSTSNGTATIITEGSSFEVWAPQ